MGGASSSRRRRDDYYPAPPPPPPLHSHYSYPPPPPPPPHHHHHPPAASPAAPPPPPASSSSAPRPERAALTAPPPEFVEHQQARKVKNDVNLHKDTIRLVRDDADPDRRLVAFTFDAVTDGSITIYYFAKEGKDCSFSSVYPELQTTTKIPFQKGLVQQFVQPSGSGVDFGFFSLDELSNPSGEVFPLVVYAEARPSPEEEPRDTAVFPCRHLCMCSECAKTLRANFTRALSLPNHRTVVTTPGNRGIAHPCPPVSHGYAVRSDSYLVSKPIYCVAVMTPGGKGQRTLTLPSATITPIALIPIWYQSQLSSGALAAVAA
ncbi:hypothetical protein GUJ93_ZPchr0005g15812 [Zizania palustris]|uniref:RING-type E3 ubiquitin transferase n=1 Tax=Zizania palustris TaxID=103762 RepID=A0A8J5SXJ0_ZIZPA|nr:hypothetical protein GUJ93_ZPchr0005g15812 [Zizania palustris]